MRFKTKYKSCLWTRNDIWGDLLCKEKSFLRPKWDALMGTVRSRKRRRRPISSMLEGSLKNWYHPFFYDYKSLEPKARANQVYKYNRWGYRNTLALLFSFRRFYGDISHRSFKRFCSPWVTRRHPTQRVMEALEGRLDVCLYRVGFFHSIYYSRQAVLHHGVLINGKKTKNRNYVLKKGDLVEFCPEHREKIKSRLLKRFELHMSPYAFSARFHFTNKHKYIWHLIPTPSWIQTDYSSLSFIFCSDQISMVPFPFKPDLDQVLWASKYGRL